MVKIVILSFLTTFVFVLAKDGKLLNKLSQNSYISNQIDSYESLEGEEDTSQAIDKNKPRQIKITYNLKKLDDLRGNRTYAAFIPTLEKLEKALNLASLYFKNLITIKSNPRTLSSRWKHNLKQQCDIADPSEEVIIGRDSDLHIYVSYSFNRIKSYSASSQICNMEVGIGPTHGKINFNLHAQIFKNKINSLDFDFQSLMQTIIHEIIHILGFSYQWKDKWVDSNEKPYINSTVTGDLRGVETIFVRTPNVLKAAQEYYGCASILGMPLENFNERGRKSHWEASVIIDEIMNPKPPTTNRIMSIFTISLLKDTGFYSSINEGFIEPSFFGKGKGCSFFEQTHESSLQEYCNLSNSGIQSCDYYRHGGSYCDSDQYQNQYGIWKTEKLLRCWDINNLDNSVHNRQRRGLDFGINSKCFMSSLNKSFDSKMLPSCYNYFCTQDQTIVIEVGHQKVICKQGVRQMELSEYKGQIECPQDINEFCHYKKICPNHCSSNGYCINGECLCLDSYEGEDCSKRIQF